MSVITGDGSFWISRDSLRRAWIEGRLRFEREVLPVSFSDPDAFTLHGSEFAVDRWADDGGAL